MHKPGPPNERPLAAGHMRLVLLGGSSYVGSALRHSPGWQPEWRWTFCSPSQLAGRGGVQLDLLDRHAVSSAAALLRPTHVIDAALPARGDPARAAEAARWRCDAFTRHDPTLRYLLVSSDAVFSGDLARPYHEADLPRPLTSYGAAKLAVERVVRSMVAMHCVVRTCLVYGPEYGIGGLRGRVSAILQGLEADDGGEWYIDQYRTPTFAGDLAERLPSLACSSFVGTVHLAGLERMSRADFVRRIAKAAGADPSRVRVVRMSSGSADAPDTSLDSSLARMRLGWAPRDTAAALSAMSRGPRGAVREAGRVGNARTTPSGQ